MPRTAALAAPTQVMNVNLKVEGFNLLFFWPYLYRKKSAKNPDLQQSIIYTCVTVIFDFYVRHLQEPSNNNMADACRGQLHLRRPETNVCQA